MEIIIYCLAFIILLLTFIILLDYFHFDGELQIFESDEKETYRFVVYKNIENIKTKKKLKFKVIKAREKQR